MNIANNILKHSLQNVYFLAGTPLAGKTTMSKVLEEKHGFLWFDENHMGTPFKTFESICEEKYQPIFCAGKKRFDHQQKYDWDAHYNRSAQGIIASRPKDNEFMEFAIIELIKLSQVGRVITDYYASLDFLLEISDSSRIACLLTAPHLITAENYGSRDDHSDYWQWLTSLNDAEKKIAKEDEIFQIDALATYEEAKKHNLFSIVRTEKSTVQDTLRQLETHFGLKG